MQLPNQRFAARLGEDHASAGQVHEHAPAKGANVLRLTGSATHLAILRITNALTAREIKTTESLNKNKYISSHACFAMRVTTTSRMTAQLLGVSPSSRL